MTTKTERELMAEIAKLEKEYETLTRLQQTIVRTQIRADLERKGCWDKLPVEVRESLEGRTEKSTRIERRPFTGSIRY